MAGSTNSPNLFICDVAFGAHIHSNSPNGGIPLSDKIWARGDFLWFVTVAAVASSKRI